MENIIQRASEADSQSCSIEISDIGMYAYVKNFARASNYVS